MVDVDAATEAGIVVANTPDIFIEEVWIYPYAHIGVRQAGQNHGQDGESR